MKKGLLIGLGILLVLVIAPFIFLRLAFGPLHDSITIDLGEEGELICDETYNADFADEFYDVKMVLQTENGKKLDFGSVTFHNRNWSKQVKIRRVGDWLLIVLQPNNFVQVKILNTSSGRLNDTTLLPFDLRKDLLYKERFKDKPNHLYSGSSKIMDVSGDVIEVNYQYQADTEYPSEFLVNQRVTHEIDRKEGKIHTKEIHERIVQ